MIFKTWRDFTISPKCSTVLMYMKYSKIETNTSWQFCFSKMHIVESEWLFETLNSSQPLALGWPLPKGGWWWWWHLYPKSRCSKEKKRSYPVALILSASASPSNMMLVKTLSLSDAHLPVNMAPGIYPVNSYWALALSCAWWHWQGLGYHGG